MALQRKADWVSKFNELMVRFPHIDSEQLLPKSTADYYYRAVALLHEASTVSSNFGVTSISEFSLFPPAAFRLQYITPCLAVSVEELKQEVRDELFESDRWVFTSKRNGIRGWLLKMGGYVALYSRNYSAEDGRLLGYQDHLLPILHGLSDFDEDFVIDVEVELSTDVDIETLTRLDLPHSPLECVGAVLRSLPHTSVQLQNDYHSQTGRALVSLNLIAPLYWKGQNFINRRLSDSFSVRREVLDTLQVYLPSLYDIDMVVGSRECKVEFLETILSMGGEGVVAHNLDGFYNTGVNRRKDVFVKLKRSVSATNLRGSTVDAWVSGFELGTKGTKNENRISSLVLSVWLRDSVSNTVSEHVIARVAGLPDKVVDAISDYSNITPVLRQGVYDTVVEVDGQSISAVNWRLTHPRLIRFREDKSKEDCYLTSEFLESCVDRVAHHTRL